MRTVTVVETDGAAQAPSGEPDTGVRVTDAESVEACLEESTRARVVGSEEGSVFATWKGASEGASVDYNVSIIFMDSEEEAQALADDAGDEIGLVEALGTAVIGWDNAPFGTSMKSQAAAVRACVLGEEPPTQAAAPPPPPPADPKASVTSNCDYLLPTDFESLDYRFVADAHVRNTGNVGVVVRVRATWAQIGASPVAETKTIRVGYKRVRTVRFDRPASQSEIDRHQSADSTCRVKATIVDKFGAPRG